MRSYLLPEAPLLFEHTPTGNSDEVVSVHACLSFAPTVSTQMNRRGKQWQTIRVADVGKPFTVTYTVLRNSGAEEETTENITAPLPLPCALCFVFPIYLSYSSLKPLPSDAPFADHSQMLFPDRSALVAWLGARSSSLSPSVYLPLGAVALLARLLLKIQVALALPLELVAATLPSEE